MSKAFVDEMIKHMRLAGMVAKAAPWMVEGMGDKAMNVRYVGIIMKDDWSELFSGEDNVLLKFIIDRNSARIEFYLANKPPFVRFTSRIFTDSDKWETVLGEVKRRLKRDKAEWMNHTDKIGNWYVLIHPWLK